MCPVIIFFKNNRKTEDLELFANAVQTTTATLQDLWKLQLEAIEHITPTMAKAVVDRYRSPRRLQQEYSQLSIEEAQALLQNLPVMIIPISQLANFDHLIPKNSLLLSSFPDSSGTATRPLDERTQRGSTRP